MTGGWALVAAAATGLAMGLFVRGAPALRPPPTGPTPATPPGSDAGWLHRHRPLWSCLAGAGAYLLLGGPLAPVAAVAAAVATWVVVTRAEPADARRRRAELRRDLPHVVDLFAAMLRAGAAPADGMVVVAGALPGAVGDRLRPVAARLALGLDPAQVWAELAADPDLGRLGRALERAHASGAPVAASVERLADDLAARSRSDAEERARAVGVKAALPLGLCLLPAFVLIGIVPLVVALLATVDLG
jgi:Flp pilus assembly protein TadB